MNAVQPIANVFSATDAPKGGVRGLLTRLWPSVIGYSVILAAVLLVMKLPGATDYVGPDNDDGMRLVEVRDFLAGQGWFDLMQYRLGLDGGTLMHWSRLIDLPIASLIWFFGLFAAARRPKRWRSPSGPYRSSCPPCWPWPLPVGASAVLPACTSVSA